MKAAVFFYAIEFLYLVYTNTRIQERAYTAAHSQCFLAMAHTRIPEGFVLAPSTSSRYVLSSNQNQRWV